LNALREMIYDAYGVIGIWEIIKRFLPVYCGTIIGGEIKTWARVFCEILQQPKIETILFSFLTLLNFYKTKPIEWSQSQF